MNPSPHKTCDTCERPARTNSATYCDLHYSRLRHTGTTAERPRLAPVVRPRGSARAACIADACESTDCGTHGYCRKHYIRFLRHGTSDQPRPANRRKAERHPMWSADEVTYSGAHQRVRNQRGSASLRVCACGSPARQWSYAHNDPNEKRSEYGPYSADPAFYRAMCVPCHKRADLDYLACSRVVLA